MVAWRRRREQRQTPGDLAVAVRAFDTAVSKAGAARVVEAAVHWKGSARRRSECGSKTAAIAFAYL